MLKAWMATIGTLMILSTNASADTSGIFKASGVVKELRAGSIVLETREGVKEFRRDLLTQSLPEALRVGDRVTVTYTLHVEQLKKPGQAQQPGQKPGAPGVVDDRAFYPA